MAAIRSLFRYSTKKLDQTGYFRYYMMFAHGRGGNKNMQHFLGFLHLQAVTEPDSQNKLYYLIGMALVVAVYWLLMRMMPRTNTRRYTPRYSRNYAAALCAQRADGLLAKSFGLSPEMTKLQNEWWKKIMRASKLDQNDLASILSNDGLEDDIKARLILVMLVPGREYFPYFWPEGDPEACFGLADLISFSHLSKELRDYTCEMLAECMVLSMATEDHRFSDLQYKYLRCALKALQVLPGNSKQAILLDRLFTKINDQKDILSPATR